MSDEKPIYTAELKVVPGIMYKQTPYVYHLDRGEGKLEPINMTELVPLTSKGLISEEHPSLYLVNVRLGKPGPIPGSQMQLQKVIRLLACNLEEAQLLAPRAQALALEELEAESLRASILYPGAPGAPVR